jgi:DNA polymerase-3 subunit alpha
MIPWVISPYSFDGSVVRFEKLALLLKSKGLKSVILADRNFHAAVKFNTIMRKHGLIPVHGLWKGGRIFVARNREEFDRLVRYYSGETHELEDIPVFHESELTPVRYLDVYEKKASIFMRKVFELDEDVQGFPEKCEDVADALNAEAYDLRVNHRFPTPPKNWNELLIKKAEPLGEEYVSRLKRELEVIKRKGFTPYIYTVEKVVEIAKKMGIKVGPGRGSAVGSLVAYLCGITEVDPIKYDLLFERFLNEERQEPPDIDVDVEDRRRKDLIKELSKSFQVYQVSTFGNLTEKSLKNLINSVLPDASLEEKNEIYKIVYGLPHHPSVHAAGVVISENPLPLPTRTEEDIPITDYDMYDLQEIGVVKIDILGLKTISFIKDFKKEIFDYSDEKTYHLISKGKTLGVFQLEGLQARKLCRRISPRNMDELSILLALNRPGPLRSGLDVMFSNPKNVPEFFRKTFPETRGVLIYQEQIMRLAMFAGLSGTEADILRRAIAKKEREKMEPLLEKMKKGLLEKGMENAEQILEILLNFSSYAFNKSHSVAYAHITYQTAYLKVHHLEEFFKLYFAYNSSDTEKIFLAVQELRSEGYRVHPPDINTSGKELVFHGKDVYLPLTVVKGVGATLVEQIEKIRPINSVRELQERVTGVPRNVVENLITAGAFDKLYENRKLALEELNKKVEKDILEIRSLFGEKVEQESSTVKIGDITELEEKSMGFPLTPVHEVPTGLFARIADVFTYGRILPVLVKRVSRNIVTDGLSVCRLRTDVPDGVHLVLLSPLQKIIKIWPFNENTRFVYRVDPTATLEKAGQNEITEVLKNGAVVRYEGYRPLTDEYRYRIVPR